MVYGLWFMVYGLSVISYQLYRFRLHRNDLTGPRTQRTQREIREMNNSDVTGFDIISYQQPQASNK